jgi:hypothetical protein
MKTTNQIYTNNIFYSYFMASEGVVQLYYNNYKYNCAFEEQNDNCVYNNVGSHYKETASK